MKRILIVGGGVSGVVAAIFAKKEDNEVIIFERNSTPLKKLLMTGNGKCNYLNEVYNESCYHSMSPELISEIINESNLFKVRKFFDDLGIVPKIKNGYYYPFSNQASTIQKVLLQKLQEIGVKMVEGVCITGIEKKNDTFLIKSEKNSWEGDYLILSTGSSAYPKTGSDGMGYRFLKEFHHTVIKPLPALVQLIGKGNYFKEWDGVRTDVEMSLYEDGKFCSQETGEIQLTDYGISGICTFNLSHFVTRGLDLCRKEEIQIDFIPFVKENKKEWLNAYSEKHSTKNLKELLEGFLNSKLVNTILMVSHLSKNRKYWELSEKEKGELLKYLSKFPVEIVGSKGFDSCQICNGGVSLLEINRKTMESFKIPHLYIVGELLDLNGNCGGYNLTLCWISGQLAGRAIGEENDTN